MSIRHAEMTDLDRLAEIEAAGYPAAEGASKESIRNRLKVYPDYFWVLERQGSICAFVNGFVTNQSDLTDDMYDDPSMHDPNGAWQMIFSVVTAPEAQHTGCASELLRRVTADARAAGRKGVVLTCKDRLIGFYAQFGFVDEGISGSTHGDVVWHQMRLTY